MWRYLISLMNGSPQDIGREVVFEEKLAIEKSKP